MGVSAQGLKSIVFTGKMGFPIGKSAYENLQYAQPALFSNMGHVYSFGFEANYNLDSAITLGYTIGYNSFGSWNSEISNRYNNASLKSYELGPIVSFKIPALSFSKFESNLIVSPYLSYVKYNNSNSQYYIKKTDKLSNGSTYQNTIYQKETTSAFSQILPGLYTALQYSLLTGDDANCFVRAGINIGMTKKGIYPDSYFCYPSIALGCTLNKSLFTKVSKSIAPLFKRSDQFELTHQPAMIGDSRVFDFCFASENSTVYIASEKNLSKWSVKDKSQLLILNSSVYQSLDVSPDGSMLVASSNDGSIAVWTLANDSLINTFRIEAGIPTIVKFVEHGAQLIVGLENGSLLKYNPVSGKQEAEVKTGSGITDIAVNDSLSLVATGGEDGAITLWNSAILKKIDTKTLHKGSIRNLTFDSEGYRIYSCGNDGKLMICRNTQDGISATYQAKGYKSPVAIANRKGGVFSYATATGTIYTFSSFSGYKYKAGEKIYKIKFVGNKEFIVLAYSTDNGIKILNAIDMEEERNSLMLN
jgi:WD40 repeat protein